MWPWKGARRVENLFLHFYCFLHVFKCSLIPSVRNCSINSHQNGRKDIQSLGCFQSLDWWCISLNCFSFQCFKTCVMCSPPLPFTPVWQGHWAGPVTVGGLQGPSSVPQQALTQAAEIQDIPRTSQRESSAPQLGPKVSFIVRLQTLPQNEVIKNVKNCIYITRNVKLKLVRQKLIW